MPSRPPLSPLFRWRGWLQNGGGSSVDSDPPRDAWLLHAAAPLRSLVRLTLLHGLTCAPAQSAPPRPHPLNPQPSPPPAGLLRVHRPPLSSSYTAQLLSLEQELVRNQAVVQAERAEHARERCALEGRVTAMSAARHAQVGAIGWGRVGGSSACGTAAHYNDYGDHGDHGRSL
jgi:hypothetical protein